MTPGRHSNDRPDSREGADAALLRLRRLVGGAELSPRGDRSPNPASLEGLVGGVRPKRLVDLLGAQPGGCAALVGLRLALLAHRERGELVVIDPDRSFYPPAAIAWGLDARRLLVVRPRSAREALDAAVIALRSPAVSAVWAALGKIDSRAFRRLLLAAEAGEALGVLVRDAVHDPQPSWADVQLRVTPIATPGRPDGPLLARVTRRRNRHGPAGGSTLLSLDWRTGDFLDAPLPDANLPPHALPLGARLAGATKTA